MGRLSRPLTTTLAAAALGLNAGCYSYVRVPAAQSPAGTELRVTLADQGAGDLARFLGPRAASLEGRVVTGSDTALTISVVSITRTTGVEETWPGDQVVIPRAAIATTETRRFAATRSLLLAGAIVAAGILIGAGLKSGADVNGSTGGPGNPGQQ
jgi:hypothetical protein